MRLLLFFILCLVLTFTELHFVSSVQAQSQSEITTSELRDISATNRVPIRRAVNTEGSPFLNEEFSNGTIHLKNGQQTVETHIRYNSHEQSIEFMDYDNIYVIEGAQVAMFEFEADGKTYTFKKGFDAHRLSEDDFVRVFTEGEVTFFARYSTSYHRGTASYGTATRQDRFLSNSSYFIAKKGDSPDRIRSLSERRVMRYIEAFEEDVKLFAKQNGTNFSEPDDVAELFKFYNSLFIEE